MIFQKGFGLIGMLITVAIVASIAVTSFYTLYGIKRPDTLVGDEEHESKVENYTSVLQQARDVAQEAEDRNTTIELKTIVKQRVLLLQHYKLAFIGGRPHEQ